MVSNIKIIKNIKSDFDPLVFYKKIIKSRASLKQNSILLESQKFGRYSYIALNPYKIFKSKEYTTTIHDLTNNTASTHQTNPFELLKNIFNKNIPRKNKILFQSGAIGYFSYDSAEYFLKEELNNLTKIKIEKQNKILPFPDIYLMFPSDIIAFDHKKNVLTLNTTQNQFYEKLLSSQLIVSKQKSNVSPKLKSNFSRQNYIKKIKKCKNYVLNGDSYQIKISQRFETKIEDDPLEIYEKLKSINPSPFAAFVNFDDCILVSSSPERLVKIKNKNIETRPIGGTYPVSNISKEDEFIKKQFLNDPKEIAEHTMLIDLERNDLGRVCKPGTIKINEHMLLERYSHLWHIVTNIKGKLETDKTIFDAIKTMFPGGTITGCPKIRTMQIIKEIEPTKRGPYSGSIGFLTFSNEMDFNLIIRTLIINPKNKKGYIQVGGGIVADSNPQKEYEETINKGQALFNAILK